MMFYRLFTFALILFFTANPCHAGFSGYLKADTAVTIKIGPFVDDTDGNTAETALTISQADVRLSKNAGNFAQKTQADAATHDELGYYNCSIDTTDTNTEGRLKIVVHESGALLVEQSYQIVNANVYDSLYAVAATDYLQIDTLQLGGITQSATDLKDFADAGYDPATDKVQGVVLTDTCTTNTDLVSAASVVNEWETQSQADPTGFHVNLYEIGGTAQTANDNGADINAILVDTSAVDTTTEMRTFLTGADTAVSTVTTAQVNTEADSALSDIHLDHLLAVDYDPAAKPGTATALLNEIIESDVGVSRFTENSLEQAPSGTGASAATIADAVWSEAQADHVGAGTFGITASEIAAIPTTAMRGTDSAALAADAITDIINIVPVIPNAIDLATILIRNGIVVTNALGNLPTTTEITPGTITINRKAVGAETWTTIVNAEACLEVAGLIYYNEVFDSAAGYSAGDSIQMLFSGQKITVGGVDHEIGNSNNLRFQTHIREEMRGTDGANTVVPDVAGVAATPAEVATALTDYDPPTKTEMDTAHALLATPAQVNTEVSDVIKTDTISELSAGAPDATPTLEDALMLLYMKERNKTQTTASEFRITNDAGTVITESDLTDNGTTFEKSEQRAAN